MNITGLGESLIDTLVDEKVINDFSDLYSLTTKKLIELDRIALKSSENILNSIDALKNIALYGSPDAVKSKIDFYKSKYGDLSSIIYIGVPKTNLEVYDSSLEKFAKNV